MRRHISYANVAATLALVLSMSGGALAASHYLINSTKQINPKVLKTLTNDTKGDTSLINSLLPSASVARANTANSATSATSATTATTAASATNATNASHATAATNSEQLGGLPASTFLQETVTVYVTKSVPNASFSTAIAACPVGYQAVGGGVDPSNVFSMEVTSSGPTIREFVSGEEVQRRPLEITEGQHGVAGGWYAAVKNETGSLATMKVVAICAK